MPHRKYIVGTHFYHAKGLKILDTALPIKCHAKLEKVGRLIHLKKNGLAAAILCSELQKSLKELKRKYDGLRLRRVGGRTH